MTISIITTARSDFEALALLRALGVPFRRSSGDREAGVQSAGVKSALAKH
jgi:hypothetical protein